MVSELHPLRFGSVTYPGHSNKLTELHLWRFKPGTLTKLNIQMTWVGLTICWDPERRGLWAAEGKAPWWGPGGEPP